MHVTTGSVPVIPLPPSAFAQPPQTLMNQKLKLFISYGREDITNSFAERLYEDLKSKGYEPILDVKDFILGNSLSDSISEGIAKCDIMILILSQKYSKSQWCIDELTFARKKARKIIIIKRQEECELSNEVNFQMRNDLYLAVTRDEEYNDKLPQLIKALEEVNLNNYLSIICIL